MELIGDYYAEKVLPQKKLVEHELLGYSCWGETEITHNLLGWQVHAGKKHKFDCRSELEARYLKIFLELGWRRVAVPDDETQLAEILPRLEYLKRRADEIIEGGLATVFDRKLKAEVRRKVYRKISGIDKNNHSVEEAA